MKDLNRDDSFDHLVQDVGCRTYDRNDDIVTEITMTITRVFAHAE